MPEYIISKNLKFSNAKEFKDSLSSNDTPTVGYVFIGNYTLDVDSIEVDTIEDTEVQQKKCWDNMIAGKKITGNELRYVIPIIPWESKVYSQYDDILTFEDLSITNPIYVMYDNNVYKCLSNNYGEISIFPPIGFGVDGNVITSDFYIWKYLYKIPEEDSFLTDSWAPIPSSVNELEYISNSYAVPGELTTIVISNSGSGYYNNTINVESFLTACSTITFDPIESVENTLAVNMGVSGPGIESGTYITSIDNFYRKFTLSTPTINSGGGSNTIFVYTRTTIDGDGYGAIANTTIANTEIEKIELTSFGKEYKYANVNIYGTGTNGAARAIISPVFGHGYNCAKELGAHNIMVNMNFNSSELGVISTDTFFSQYGLLKNPYKYNDTSSVAFNDASSVISQTTDITLIETVAYTKNEYVYQGDISNPFFSGIINTIEDNNIIKVTNTKGTPIIGYLLKGSTEETITGRTVVDITFPEFTKYSGDILYVKNILPVNRTTDQIENIKFIVKF